jgi:MFS family permease
MLLPELPSYLSHLGGGEYKGLIIALFTLTAGISRPFSGKLTDKIGRVPVMVVGSTVCFICGFLYPILTSVSGFLFLRMLHGFSTGFKPTATSAYVADLVPKEKWGEALGIHGLCFSTGMTIGPAIGSTITQFYPINIMFYVSSVLALLSILILFNMKETLKSKQAFKIDFLKISKNELINKQVLPVLWVTILSYISYGALVSFIPDWSENLGLHNKGLFFMVFTVSSLIIRFLAGRLSDSYGRTPILKLALILLSVAFVVIGFAQSAYVLIMGAILYGFAQGMFSPALSAWTIDLSDQDKRGKSVATMYIGLEAGIGIGAFLAGWYYQDVIYRLKYIFYGAALSNIFALLYLLWYLNKPKINIGATNPASF